MTRRRALGLAGAATVGWGQSPYPGLTYRPYYRCLPDYLRARAAEIYEARSQVVARASFVNVFLQRQRVIRDAFWRSVGGRPEVSPLNVRVTGGFDREGYRLETLTYESQPGLVVTANLYVPTAGSGPFPGVLFQMGHAAPSKAYPQYQRCCQGLARLGFVVLAFDPMGQGERIDYPDASGAVSRLGTPTAEHGHLGRLLLLNGDSIARWMVWDAVRGLDVLAAHPKVDRTRLGGTGQSGGGTLTMLLAAADERLEAAVLCDANTENFVTSPFEPPGSADDAEQCVVPQNGARVDRWDLLQALAPKPLRVVVSAKDAQGTYSTKYLTNGWEEYEALRKFYALSGDEGKLDWKDSPLPHSLAMQPRVWVYDWFGRSLQGRREAITTEPATQPETAEALRAVPQGTARRKSPRELARMRLPAPNRPLGRDELRDLLGVEARREPAVLRRLASTPSLEGSVDAIEVQSAPQVFVPAWLLRSARAETAKPLLVIVEPGGRSREVGEGGLLPSLAAAGCAVCAPDLRGYGDMTPEVPRQSPGYAVAKRTEDAFAWASLLLERPLLGQRVTDLLAVVEAVGGSAEGKGRRLVLAGRGAAALPALFAAALSPRVESVHLSGLLVSYRSLWEHEEYDAAFANFLPGLLRRGDVSDVLRLVAPRAVTVAGALNGAGVRMEVEAATRALGAMPHVRVMAGEGWTVQELTGGAG